jgi:quercetin dioxygenase-like cupin family protein
MKRRKFIQSGLLAAPVASLAPEIVSADGKPVTKSFVVKNGEDRFNEPLMFRGVNPNLVKVSARDTGGLYSMFEYEGLVKMGPDLHVHLKQDETFYVVEGEYLFQVGEERRILTAGDSIFLPRAIPHTWLQLSDKGKLMYMLQPAGKMEEFFKTMNALTGPLSPEEYQKINLAHGMKRVGPPLEL